MAGFLNEQIDEAINYGYYLCNGDFAESDFIKYEQMVDKAIKGVLSSTSDVAKISTGKFILSSRPNDFRLNLLQIIFYPYYATGPFNFKMNSELNIQKRYIWNVNNYLSSLKC